MAGLITGGYDVSDLGDFAGHLVYFTICWMYFGVGNSLMTDIGAVWAVPHSRNSNLFREDWYNPRTVARNRGRPCTNTSFSHDSKTPIAILTETHNLTIFFGSVQDIVSFVMWNPAKIMTSVAYWGLVNNIDPHLRQHISGMNHAQRWPVGFCRRSQIYIFLFFFVYVIYMLLFLLFFF